MTTLIFLSFGGGGGVVSLGLTFTLYSTPGYTSNGMRSKQGNKIITYGPPEPFIVLSFVIYCVFLCSIYCHLLLVFYSSFCCPLFPGLLMPCLHKRYMTPALLLSFSTQLCNEVWISRCYTIICFLGNKISYAF